MSQSYWCWSSDLGISQEEAVHTQEHSAQTAAEDLVCEHGGHMDDDATVIVNVKDVEGNEFRFRVYREVKVTASARRI